MAVRRFVAATILTLVGTVAHRLPLLHQLPPPLGAPRPPRDVEFRLEGVIRRTASHERQGVLLRIVIPPEGRPDEIPRVLVNAYVVGATHIIALCHPGRHIATVALLGRVRTGLTGRSLASRFRSGRTKCSSRSRSRSPAPTRPY
jgi:hypothetical protein